MVLRVMRVLCVLALLAFAPRALAADAGLTLDPKVGLNAYAALVDQQVAAARQALRVLAATDTARSGDWKHISGPLGVVGRGAPASAVWFARPDGSYFTTAAGLQANNISDRPYFPGLMGGKEVAGYLVIGKSTSRPSAIVAVPVLDGTRVVGALGVSLDLEKLTALVDQEVGLPTQVMFYAIDDHGRTALHREAGRLFEFADQQGSPSLSAAVREMFARTQGMVRYEFQGAQRTAIFKRSRETGWVYALRW